MRNKRQTKYENYYDRIKLKEDVELKCSYTQVLHIHTYIWMHYRCMQKHN